MWAYAKLGHCSSALFHAVAEISITGGMSGTFNSQDISNIVWAYANVNHPSHTLFDTLADQCCDGIQNNNESFNPQTIANIVW